MTNNFFRIEQKDKNSRARIGKINLAHGFVQTPVFMPVGTSAAVKTLTSEELKQINVQIILSNTYHLNIKPGTQVIQKHKGLHNFMGWDKPILTDSGGFQVFSLAEHAKISDEGVKFRNPINGQLDFFTPEKVVEIQKILGSDIMMILDQPSAYPEKKKEAKIALDRTTRWAHMSRDIKIGQRQKMFAIMQGSTHKDLREQSAKELVAMDFDGYAIGGLSVGEPKEILFEVLNYSTDFLPQDKPRYLMGVGDPLSLIKGIRMGVDMFDCVLPTRIARNGSVFSSQGRLNLKNSKYKEDIGPLDENCTCYVCSKYSRAYLRHQYMIGEILAHRLLSWHNLYYLTDLVEKAKKCIKEGNLHILEEKMEMIYAKSTSI